MSLNQRNINRKKGEKCSFLVWGKWKMFLAVWSRNPLGNKCAENIYFVLVRTPALLSTRKKFKEEIIILFSLHISQRSSSSDVWVADCTITIEGVLNSIRTPTLLSTRKKFKDEKNGFQGFLNLIRTFRLGFKACWDLDLGLTIILFISFSFHIFRAL